MKKSYITLLLYFFFVLQGQSQVGIPSNNPNKNAILDLNQTDGTNIKGLLLPKIDLNATNSTLPMSEHSAGMYIYNTADRGSTTTLVKPGPYFNTGTEWYSLFSINNGWSTKGNAATNATSNFIGTTDAVDFVTKTAGIERYRMTSSGQWLLNTTTVPTGGTNAKVIINSSASGALQLKDGTEGLGYVLTSDANGVATWREKELVLNYATIPPSGVNVLATPLNTWYYSNINITLPPGKWLVSVTMLLNKGSSTAVTAANEFWSVSSSFSNSATTLAISPDIQTNKMLITGMLFPGCIYNFMKGSVIITNSTAANKTYYYMARATGRNMTGQIANFGGPWAENVITWRSMP
ncbi:hypothetical protein [Flavobacterium phragmitis]|uniref:Uncharacterized protein n=1 Tax=Flavobacterium phragmitis TaxID=739143 RepID=A0A1I1SJ47_9FLAO|nr:hypothetical protein [Flavobacterium phragmitis]SFD44678.1 hypothetical protein SAMN05216297_1087 [Flavobacterium phragmitis]